MSELKVYVMPLKTNILGKPILGQTYYSKAEADKVIEAKDKEIAELKKQYKDMDVTHTVHIAKMNARIEELEDNVDVWKKEIRRLKRALWLAHAYKAKFKRWWLHGALDYEASMIRPDTKTIKRIKGKIGNCEKSERKCRAIAEEYNV